MESEFVLDEHQKEVIRNSMVKEAGPLQGIPYKMSKTQAEWDAGLGAGRDLTKLPDLLDCEGLAHWVCGRVGLKFPPFPSGKGGGAQQQFDFTVATATPKPGDFAFFGTGKDITHIYHIGMVYNDEFIIEARGHQEGASFKTGEVILRERKIWEAYANFCGYRAHPKLA